jgi:cytochrome b subunit of formate dehydrogenase
MERLFFTACAAMAFAVVTGIVLFRDASPRSVSITAQADLDAKPKSNPAD